MRCLTLACLLMLSSGPWVVAASAQVYECVRPDGKVICTVTDTSGDPSVTCNHDCPDCNMVCAARKRIHAENGQPITPPSVPGRRIQAKPTVKETPEYCQAQLDNCTANCERTVLNKSQYEREACISSCRDTFSGCGMTPREDVEPRRGPGHY